MLNMLRTVLANIAGVNFGAKNVLANPAIREGIKRFTEWPTIPQVPPAHSRPAPPVPALAL
jgi:glutaredoxin-related protein